MIAKLFLISRAAARVAFVVFSHNILFRVHEAVHVISNLRLEVCDNSASCGIAEKVYTDYAWKDLCEDSTKLKQLRVAELNKYLKHHGLHQHIKSLKNDKVKVIARHWVLQMNPEGPDPLMLQTQLRERDGADKESLQDSDSDEDEYSRSESDENDENDNDQLWG